MKEICHNSFNLFFSYTLSLMNTMDAIRKDGHREFKSPTCSAETYLHKCSHYTCKSFFVRFSAIQIRNRNDFMQFMQS